MVYKRRIRIIVVLLIIFNFVLLGCEFNKEHVDNNEELIYYTEYNDIQKVSYSDDAKDILLVISSIEEINALKSDYGFVIVEENEWQKFDDYFFVDNSLIIINIVKNYTGPHYELEKIKIDNKIASICVVEDNKRADVNDEMTCLFYVLSVNKESIKSIEKYEIVYVRR